MSIPSSSQSFFPADLPLSPLLARTNIYPLDAVEVDIIEEPSVERARFSDLPTAKRAKTEVEEASAKVALASLHDSIEKHVSKERDAIEEQPVEIVPLLDLPKKKRAKRRGKKTSVKEDLVPPRGIDKKRMSQAQLFEKLSEVLKKWLARKNEAEKMQKNFLRVIVGREGIFHWPATAFWRHIDETDLFTEDEKGTLRGEIPALKRYLKKKIHAVREARRRVEVKGAHDAVRKEIQTLQEENQRLVEALERGRGTSSSTTEAMMRNFVLSKEGEKEEESFFNKLKSLFVHEIQVQTREEVSSLKKALSDFRQASKKKTAFIPKDERTTRALQSIQSATNIVLGYVNRYGMWRKTKCKALILDGNKEVVFTFLVEVCIQHMDYVVRSHREEKRRIIAAKRILDEKVTLESLQAENERLRSSLHSGDFA